MVSGIQCIYANDNQDVDYWSEDYRAPDRL
jgi:hypothetical protein